MEAARDSDGVAGPHFHAASCEDGAGDAETPLAGWPSRLSIWSNGWESTASALGPDHDDATMPADEGRGPA